MAHEDTVIELMEELVIGTPRDMGEIMAHLKIWKEGPSATNNSQKAMNNLTDLRKLVKGKAYYKLPYCKSEHKQHSQELTKILVQIKKFPYDSVIIREKKIPIGLIPDALVLLKNQDLGRMLIIEAVCTETERYLENKIRTWENWENSLEFLSELFGYKILHFEFLILGGMDHPKSLKMEDL